MLKRLTIQNYALIESLDIEFPDGLVIMTGETGAGKSVLLGAVSLLSGSRADKAILRDEGRSCVVEGVFETEGQEKILRRVISGGMRSRYFVDDCPVSASEMEEEASSLLDIHGQRDNILLADRLWQLDMIDGYCSNGSLLQKYKTEYEAVKGLEKDLEEVERQIAEAEKDTSGKLSDLKKLQDASLKEGEAEALESEHSLLENAETLKENSSFAAAVLDGEESSVIHNLREAERCVEKCAAYAPHLEDLRRRLESCRIECKDIASDIEAFAESVSASPARRSQVEERLGDLYSLMKRFGVKEEAGLIALRDELAKTVLGTEYLTDRKNEILQSLSSRRENRDKLSSELSEKRRKGAAKMQKVLLGMIRDLEMPSAELSIDLASSEEEYTPVGKDRVQILFSANPKEKLVPLEKVASGGELSRIMLCIKSLMASFRKMPTMFFDEIDVGVSGSVADKMGRQIVKMGQIMQVFSITHLPQVASKGNAHLLVYKQADRNGRSAIRLKYLKGRERVMEIARLLSGEKTTPEAVANAQVLLETNK
ncbi:MAG: DNA repair protein RecN [Bacteroidales bacterium]|nr:DNA repair protein RecN [Bacteroidales bacterium]